MQNKIKNVAKTKKVILVILAISFLFVGWGKVGHSIINYNTILTALPEMSFFSTWAQQLADHGSDADNRKSADPNEAPKHYIDIDNYSEFVQNGFISQDFDSVVASHGYSFVIDQGILPWAILSAADSLRKAFEKNDMSSAVLIAADLGHYIGDSHMPLHITKNYNGQYTNQSGVHSRYESNLIGKYQSEISYTGDSLKYIENLPSYVFSMIYDNYSYVDSVLQADTAAKLFAGNTSDDIYYKKFWELSKNFTIHLFKNASYRLTCVIYTEWINAQNNISDVKYMNGNIVAGFELFQNYPNPFNPSTKIKWHTSESGFYSLKVYDVLGNEVKELVNEFKPAGTYEIEFDQKGLTSGIYFYRLKSGYFEQTRKMILLK